MEISTLLVAGVMAVSNLGGVGIMMAWYAKRIDATDQKTNDHAVLLERASENSKATADTLARLNGEVVELFKSRNEHEKDITRVNELHDLKGCKTLFQGGPHGTRS